MWGTMPIYSSYVHNVHKQGRRHVEACKAEDFMLASQLRSSNRACFLTSWIPGKGGSKTKPGSLAVQA